MKQISVVALCGLLLGLSCAVADDDPMIDDKPLSELVKQLRSQNRGLQVRSAQALSAVPSNLYSRIIPMVMPVLKSERENDKFVAAQILGAYGPIARAAIPDLLPMLKGTQYERNRAAAAKALGLILRDAKPDKEVDEVTAALIVAFGDGYEDVRRESVAACGVIGPAAKASISHLVPRLTQEQSGDAPNMVIVAAAGTCERMGPLAKEHVDLLISLMHKFGGYGPCFVSALGAIGPVQQNMVPNIVDAMEKNEGWSDFRAQGFIALRRLGQKTEGAMSYTKRVLSQPPMPWDPGRMRVATEAMKFVQMAGQDAKQCLPEIEKLAAYRVLGGDSPADAIAASNAMREEAAKTVTLLKGSGK
ncbi:MAG: hypothetical protein C0404_07345 [Verrucomicrobia bacterium]|nr:hypothetical protein [Verrucomicrobiota bacterium]